VLARSTAIRTFLALAALLGCGGPWPLVGTRATGGSDLYGGPREDAGHSAETLDEEEDLLEDQDALSSLISSLFAPPVREPDAGDGDAGPELTETPVAPGAADAGAGAAGAAALDAFEIWSLSDEDCIARLADEGVATTSPGFDTPLVRTPVLLDGPVAGVEIRPRWPRPEPVNEVMDCRLALALVRVAEIAARGGVERILYYSAYRPLGPPPERCPAGAAGAGCRREKRRYERAMSKPSQHRRALAIDIGWFERADGTTIGVLDDYERRDGQPPCRTEAKTEEGRFLRDLACALHDEKVFNVVLTPNANEAHHNHFHFDITPDARWYVIR